MACQVKSTLATFLIRLISDSLLQIWSISLWYGEDLTALTVATWSESSWNWAPIGNAFMLSSCLWMARAFVRQSEAEVFPCKFLCTVLCFTIWSMIFGPKVLLLDSFILLCCLEMCTRNGTLHTLWAFSVAPTLHDLLVLHHCILINSPGLHSIWHLWYLSQISFTWALLPTLNYQVYLILIDNFTIEIFWSLHQLMLIWVHLVLNQVLLSLFPECMRLRRIFDISAASSQIWRRRVLVPLNLPRYALSSWSLWSSISASRIWTAPWFQVAIHCCLGRASHIPCILRGRILSMHCDTVAAADIRVRSAARIRGIQIVEDLVTLPVGPLVADALVWLRLIWVCDSREVVLKDSVVVEERRGHPILAELLILLRFRPQIILPVAQSTSRAFTLSLPQHVLNILVRISANQMRISSIFQIILLLSIISLHHNSYIKFILWENLQKINSE